MDVVREIRRAFHDFMDGRITRAELEEKLWKSARAHRRVYLSRKRRRRNGLSKMFG